jgi:hypothetical protein
MAYEEQQHSPLRIFAQLQQRYSLHILKPQDILCVSGTCAIAHGDSPLYRDSEHLAPPGNDRRAGIGGALYW